MSSNNNLEALINCLQRADKITIIGHSIPDGDCVGSCLGMALALKHLGKEVEVVLSDPVPETYLFLPGQELLRKPESGPSRPVLFYLDCADPERVGELPTEFFNGVQSVINVDHHISNTYFGNYNLVRPASSSTAEICLEIMDAWGFRPDAEVATNLYTGMIMDTGSFQYDSTTPKTLRQAARLLEFGADKSLIREKLYESRSLIEIRVLGLALQNLYVTSNGKIAWVELPYRLMQSIGAEDLNFEGIINYPRSLAGVEVGLLFRETEPGLIKIGFRSRGRVDVNTIASRFGGGGHRLASGARMRGTMDGVVKTVLAEVEEAVRCTVSST